MTQTEIMLVLAAVVLVLLLVKSGDLAIAKEDLTKAEQRFATLVERSAMSFPEVAEQRAQADLAQEVREVLVRGGAVPPSGQGAARLSPRDVATVRDLVEEQGERAREADAVDRALERAGRPPSVEAQSRQEQIEQLGSDAALGATLKRSLSRERQRALQDALARADEAGAAVRGAASESLSPAQENEPVEDLLADWLNDSAATAAGKLGDQVGFDPCWPGPGGVGERRYYIAYHLSYADGRYVVRPHPDLQAGVPVVDEALAGPLSVLRSHPREAVTGQTLLTFGRRIEAAVAPLRQSGRYASECLLVATLNEEAPGSIAKFLRRDVRLYPITR